MRVGIFKERYDEYVSKFSVFFSDWTFIYDVFMGQFVLWSILGKWTFKYFGWRVIIP